LNSQPCLRLYPRLNIQKPPIATPEYLRRPERTLSRKVDLRRWTLSTFAGSLCLQGSNDGLHEETQIWRAYSSGNPFKSWEWGKRAFWRIRTRNLQRNGICPHLSC
jgi:hypothetical protein